MSIVKLNDRAVKDATTFGSISSLGEMKFISKATASASASIEFSLGDYKEYQFYFVDMHPSTDNTHFQINFSIDNGSNYNVTKTTTYFQAEHDEGDSTTGLSYNTNFDLAQSTSDFYLGLAVGNDNDQCLTGTLNLFNPSSTTFVKHFTGVSQHYHQGDYSRNDYCSGYANTTSALTNIKFQMSSGNIDAGSILMFGIN